MFRCRLTAPRASEAPPIVPVCTMRAGAYDRNLWTDGSGVSTESINKQCIELGYDERRRNEMNTKDGRKQRMAEEAVALELLSIVQ
jgi:hypothetical protein